MVTDKMLVFRCEPHNDLLSDRESNEAYCLANPGTEYAVYFPNGGQVTLGTGPLKKSATLRWLDIMKCKCLDPEQVEGRTDLRLRCPSQGYWAALVQ